jgi:hypothetical protein
VNAVIDRGGHPELAGKTSNSNPNFALNPLSSSFLNSALGGMPTTTFPSFLAAASVLSHSVCQVVCALTVTGNATLKKIPNNKIAITVLIERTVKLLAISEDHERQKEGRDQSRPYIRSALCVLCGERSL